MRQPDLRSRRLVMAKHGPVSFYKYRDPARKFCRLDPIDREIADYFGISESTISNLHCQLRDLDKDAWPGNTRTDTVVAEKLVSRAKWHLLPPATIVERTASRKSIRYLKQLPLDSQTVSAPVLRPTSC